MSAPGVEEVLASSFYYDTRLEREAAKVLPGEYYVTRDDMAIVTVLGSCVAACIRDCVSGVGGMNHFMLPDGGSERDSPVSASMRYGAYAMEVLINELLKAGARRENLEAKVFGGGSVLDGIISINVGERNARFALDYLRTERVRVAARDLLDVYPRKVYFLPRTGRVLVRKLKRLHNSTLAHREQDYARRLGSGNVQGEVELFS